MALGRGDGGGPVKGQSAGKLRVLLLDQQTLIRKGLTALMHNREDMEVVGEARDEGEVLAKMQELRPDLVLMDIHLPGGDGLEIIRNICRRYPQVKVVVLTVTDAEETMLAAIKAGARGYLLKTMEPAQLFFYLSSIGRGEVAIPPALAGRILDGIIRQEKRHEQEALLSPREKEVLRLVAGGATNREIAQTLFISENTVKNHLKSIMEKLGSKNRLQAVQFAQKHGLLAEDN